MTNMAGVAHSTNMGCNSNRLYVREDGNGMLFNIKSVRMRDVLDGASHTLLLGEITGAEGQHPSEGAGYFGYIWVTQAVQDVSQGINGPFTVPGGRNEVTDPIDGDGGGRHQELYNEISFSSWHSGGAHFCFADGSAQFLNHNIDQALLEALATRAGAEVLDLKSMY
jgi:prepilin-type processing-associated H-X9-DG protein